MQTEHYQDTMLNASTTGVPPMSMTTDGSPDVERGWSVSGIENSALVRSVYGMIAFSGMTGNALVCVVLLRVPALRTRTSLFIINLAITDFINCLWVIPFHLFPQTPPVPAGFAGELMCRIYISKFPLWMSSITSVYCLVAVTMERYVAVVHPVRYKRLFTTRTSVVIAACCWGIGFITTSFFFVLYDVVDGICVFVPMPSHVYTKLYGIFVFTVIYAFPSTIILIWHSRIIQALRKQARQLGGNPGPRAAGTGTEPNVQGASTSGGENNKHDKSADANNKHQNQWQLKMAQEMQKTFFVVIVVFMLCWAMNQFLFLVYSLGAPIDFTKMYYHFSVIVALFNSCVNPFIYVFKNKAFRRGIPRAFGCNCVSARALLSTWQNSIEPTSAAANGNSGSGRPVVTGNTGSERHATNGNSDSERPATNGDGASHISTIA